jgi:fused signal recognition particle receptor
MLGWFKKKFAEKDRQEEPVVEKSAAEAAETQETVEVVSDEVVAAVQDEPVQEPDDLVGFEPEAVAAEKPAEAVEVVEASEAVESAEIIETIETEEVVEVVQTDLVQGPGNLEGFEPESVTAEKPAEAVEVVEPSEAVEPAETLETIEAEEVLEAVQTVSVQEPDEHEGLGLKSVTAAESAPAEESIAVLEDDAVHPLVEQPVVEEPAGKKLSPEKPQAEQQKPQHPSMFRRLQDRLGKTRNSFVHRLDSLFLGKKTIDQELLDDLEEVLITADLGVATTRELLDTARISVKRNELSDPQALKGVLRDRILTFLQESDQPAELVMPESGPFVIMVVGVNGVGKTTSIGKIAAKFVNAGQSVLLVAGDTFRAAAIDQLKIWGERIRVEVVAGAPGSDPSSVVFDGVAQGVARDFDVIIIDTAGRLHTSVNLMEELKKIKRVISKKLAGAPHEVMLVLDATTGQNAISQAKLFNDVVGVTGLTLTKLDGTAKGGIVANVCRELKIPVRFIGIGEQADDLRDFDSREFVEALFS